MKIGFPNVRPSCYIFLVVFIAANHNKLSWIMNLLLGVLVCSISVFCYSFILLFLAYVY